MTLSEIKERLCAYDIRNPQFDLFIYDDEDLKNIVKREEGKCSCDNCHTGRTKLAEELLKYRKLLRSKNPQ